MANSMDNTIPKSPSYDSYEARIASYENKWPKNNPITPNLLSASGLFYFGTFHQVVTDAVQCFHCGKGICMWQPEDDPWSEHLRLSPSCQFLLDAKNSAFYQTIKNSKTFSNSNNRVCSTSKTPNIDITPISMKKAYCDRLTCKICLVHELSILFLPCSHLLSCLECATKFSTCPLCRKEIHGKLETFIA